MMSVQFYITWYALATLILGITWFYSRRLNSIYSRIGVRTFVFAFGFTTLPLGPGVDGSLIAPIAMLYLSRSDWFEASGIATLTISTVWILLFMAAVLITTIYSKFHTK